LSRANSRSHRTIGQRTRDREARGGARTEVRPVHRLHAARR
jgi:hypothetical protein